MTELLPIDLNIYGEEKELLDGLRRKERHACACMLKRYAGQIYGLALRMTGDSDEAEEVLQETLISACDNIHRFEGRSKLGTWLFRIATNAALMRLRRQKKTVSLDAAAESSDDLVAPHTIVDWRSGLEEMAVAGEIRDALETALESLSEGLRAVFLLRDVQGFNTEETADILQISQSAAKVRLHRARLQLRELLSQNPAIALDEYGIRPEAG